MEKICVDLENCYGINKLEQDFDFSEHNAVLIYASNGTMKTSFAKTFLDISNGDEPEDRIYGRDTSCNIEKTIDGATYPIEATDIFVIESFKDNFNFEKISKLLVNKDLKDQYDEIFNNIENAKSKLIKKIASLSKLKQSEIESTFLEDFPDPNKNFLDVLLSLEDKIDGNVEFPVEDMKYKIIFDNKILEFIKKDEIFDSIEEYAEKYLKLMDESEIFEINVFTHNNADNVSKELDNNNFFDVNHKISLSNGQIINNKEEFELLIQQQKEIILTDDRLLELFDTIDSGLDKNKDTREFKKILGNYQNIIPELRDIPSFKKKIWISILNKEKNNYFDLIEIYKSGKSDIEQITDEAKQEESSWKNVVDLFNKRFFVPFSINVINQHDVILKNEVPTLEFIYDDKVEEKNLDKKKLLDVLSSGEKKALYLLNVIYEIEARKIDNKPVLIIIDDITDSFDYQNKYAIVEYLHDILNEDIFKLIFLTHNFDFYRTVHSRLNIPRKNCFMVLKNPSEIKIVEGQYLNSAFSFWKKQLNGKNANDQVRILIAAIPFVRNLIEFTLGKRVDNYNILTELLHIKEQTFTLKISDLKRIYSEVWKVNFDIRDNESIYDLIFQEAKSIITEDINEINLENKITLSIAIRLTAENYMIYNIQNSEAISEIKSSQTRKLFEMFKKRNYDDPIISTLEQVNLMTPENIHLNSFMYEPILDMTDKHLRTLYSEIKEANNVRD